MEELNKKVRFAVGNFSDLSLQEQQLFEQATRVRLNAQAPYSKFSVGVAVLSEQNTIHLGCNVERCSWTQTTHAEQNAVDSMVAALGPSKIKLVTVVAAPTDTVITLPPRATKSPRTSLEKMTWCCGHCLQIIWENCFGDPTVKIMSLLPSGEIFSSTIGDSLPIRFGPEDLGISYSNQAESRGTDIHRQDVVE